jgi:tryptophan synthase alpha chain
MNAKNPSPPTNTLEREVRERLRRKRLLIMTHAVAGYPSIDANKAMLEAMEEAGADLVELQLPFTEPIADGPAFVRANQEAIRSGMGRDAYFALVAWAAKHCSFPVIFMGYFNSIYRMGAEAFTNALRDAGGCGLIVADLPPEEGGELRAAARTRGLASIGIVAPTTPAARMGVLAEASSGFLYCVARKGVTGRHTEISKGVEDFLGEVRRRTSLPLALGFGLKSAEDVHRVRGLADIAIFGTACLEAWERGGPTGYRTFLHELTEAAAR